MRFLVYSDLQATEGSERCFTDPSLPLQRYRVQRFYAQLQEIYSDHKCRGLIDLGDTTDDRSFVYRATLDVMLNGLSHFAPNRSGIKLTGNHEQLLKHTEVNSKSLFQPYFGHVDPEVLEVDGVSIICHPFLEDYEQVNSNIQQRAAKAKSKRKILLAHGDVRGIRYDSGEPCRKGIEPALLDEFDLVLMGHVHRHQKIGKSAYYVGSPFQQDFGEANQRKHVAVLDTETCQVEWVEVKGMPEYRVVDLRSFIDKADPSTEEHRYRVTLNSIEETETFYADSRSAFAEPKLTYASVVQEVQVTETTVQTDRALLERYAAIRPIAGVPDDVANELVSIGEMFLK